MFQIQKYAEEKIKEEFKKACDNTEFPEYLKLKNIFLNRKITNQYKLKPLEIALKDTIHTEILITFQKQNKELLIKYN